MAIDLAQFPLALNMPVLEVRDLYRFFHAGEEETLALRGVTFSAAAGEMAAIAGPSGSGKSTLLACIAGLDEPDGGWVKINGQRITRRPEPERAALRAREIGVMLQSGNLFRHLTITENLRLRLRLAGRTDQRRIEDLLELVGLSPRRSFRPAEISGGEAARAALAMALAVRPKLLLADEPTSEIDAASERRVMELLQNFRNEGGAVVIATHSEALAAAANRIIRLRDGHVVDHD